MGSHVGVLFGFGDSLDIISSGFFYPRLYIFLLRFLTTIYFNLKCTVSFIPNLSC